MKTEYILAISTLFVGASVNAIGCGGGNGTGGTGTTTSTTGAGASSSTATMTTVGSTSASTGKTGSATGTTTGTGNSTSTGAGFPAAPTLGAQIDRMGRAAVNTALNDPFDTTAASKTAAKDKYNQDTNRATWPTTWSAEFEKNLAIYDALDGTCGNQAAYMKPASNTPNSYATLAGVLADDALYLNTASSTCKIYLGVEANATNLLPNSDCGGRTLTENTIDETLSLLAIGMPSGVSNGITADADAQGTTFPYLAGPH